MKSIKVLVIAMLLTGCASKQERDMLKDYYKTPEGQIAKQLRSAKRWSIADSFLNAGRRNRNQRTFCTVHNPNPGQKGGSSVNCKTR